MRLPSWLRDWFDDHEQITTQLARFKADTSVPEIKPPRVLWSDCLPFPAREDIDQKMADADLLAEIAWMEKEREKELGRAPKVRSINAGRIKS